MSLTPITDAANAISRLSPNIRRFAQLVAAKLEPPAPPQPPADVYSLTLTPNYGPTVAEAAKNINAVWVYSHSSESYAPPNGTDTATVLLLDPRSTDSKGKVGNDEWWFCIRRNWPASYDPTKHGDFGTQANFHNVATNDGPAGGVGWGFGSGVSALFLGWWGTTPAVHLEYFKSGGFDIPLPLPSRGVLHEYLVHFIAGRTDGTTARPGLIEVWADGTQVATYPNCNTIQKATGPDGKTYVQKWMAANWDGDYTQNLANLTTTIFQPTGVGRTREAAVADRPVYVGDLIGSQVWNGRAPDLGAPTLVH